MKHTFTLLCALAMASAAGAQTAETPLVRIGGSTYSLEEFDYVYQKNNAVAAEKLTRSQYLDLFVDYKLKVHEAMAQGLDTAASYLREAAYYYDDLAKPYLRDTAEDSRMAHQAYERMLKEVDASHILIRLRQGADAADRERAEQRLMQARAELERGADFADVARRYSEDPSAATNGGHLGYFTAFQMVLPFEDAAYSMQPGQLSGAVESRFGLHLIRVNAVRPAHGAVRSAHIMKMVPRNAPDSVWNAARLSIDSLYAELQSGADFAAVARRSSDDRQSARKGGELPWFSVGQMVPEFSEKLMSAQDTGVVLPPFRTPFGWHIAKLLERRPIPPFAEARAEIADRLAADERSEASVDTLVARLAARYGFAWNAAAVDSIRTMAARLRRNPSELRRRIESLGMTVAAMDTATMTAGWFASECAESIVADGLDAALASARRRFVIAYEKSVLPAKYPDFRYLYAEYHDGLLVFEISKREVWDKAAADTAGCRRYFDEHRARYNAHQAFDGIAARCASKSQADRLRRLIAKGKATPENLQELFAKQGEYNQGRMERGADPEMDRLVWPDSPADPATVVVSGTYEAGTPVAFEEVRGLVGIDYQQHLDAQWVGSLRAKYRPEVLRRLR